MFNNSDYERYENPGPSNALDQRYANGADNLLITTMIAIPALMMLTEAVRIWGVEGTLRVLGGAIRVFFASL